MLIKHVKILIINEVNILFDTHTHINTKKYENILNKTISNAKENGVNKILAVGMDLETSKQAIKIANEYNEVYATVGIHPAYVNESNHLELDSLYKNEKVVAVGEIGLDFYWTIENKELQLKVFEEQILKAIKLNLPVIIHTRNSFDETYEIVKKYQGKLTGVFHCFSSDLKDAIKTIELGLYIGIDGPITFKNKNKELINIVENIDLKHILIETDSPYLTPEPFRGKMNEPANVKYVAEKIAEIKNISLEEVIKQTTINANKLFKIRG